MLIFCGIVAAILKMATGRNFSMPGINSGQHNLPTYEMTLESDNVEFVRYCGGHFENGDRQTFFNVGNQFGHDYLPTFQILMISGNFEFLPPIFLYRVQAAILKMADNSKILKTHNCSSNGDLSICHISKTPLSFMKFCPVVPEICRRQVHGLRKKGEERE